MDKGSVAVPAWAGRNQLVSLMYKTVRMVKNEGLGKTVFAAKYVTKRYFKLKELKKKYYLTPELRAQQENHKFAYEPTISLIVPLYNTDEGFLRELLASVQAQSYKKWQLCFADGSEQDRDDVGEVCREYMRGDDRISYKRLMKNEGISGNTNAAIELANGDYIALLDHDDLIAQSALFDVVTAINERNADFLYTDEATFIKSPRDSRSMHLKPDYSPDYLRGCNY
ncbi:MAG: glycosyltransferase, partial [Oscillospiraceae bacterium]